MSSDKPETPEKIDGPKRIETTPTLRIPREHLPPISSVSIEIADAYDPEETAMECPECRTCVGCSGRHFVEVGPLNARRLERCTDCSSCGYCDGQAMVTPAKFVAWKPPPVPPSAA